MLLWGLLLLIILVGLAIPILSIVLDSPVVHRMVEARQSPEGDGLTGLTKRVESLEGELEDVTRALEALREETEFIHRLLESTGESPSRQLPRPDQ